MPKFREPENLKAITMNIIGYKKKHQNFKNTFTPIPTNVNSVVLKSTLTQVGS
jgi:hypothetical protein